MSGSQELLLAGMPPPHLRNHPTEASLSNSPPVLHQDKVILCVALKRGSIERVKISRAVHEPNGGHCRCEIKEARPSARGRNKTRRVSMIGDHVLSPFGSKRHGSRGQPSYGAACLRVRIKSLGRTLIVLNLAQAGRRSSGPGAARHRLQIAQARDRQRGVPRAA
jgi:hypothetical protein